MVIVEGTDASTRDATRMCCAEMIWPDVTWSKVTGVADNMERGCVRKVTTCGMAGAADMSDRLAMENLGITRRGQQEIGRRYKKWLTKRKGR
jgi:hypothetical protein